MRRAARICFVALALMMAAVPASAGRPIEYTERATYLTCIGESEAGWAHASIMTDDFGSFGDFALWAPGEYPWDGEPRLVTGNDVEVVFGDGMASMVAGVYGGAGDEAGTVALEFTFQPGDSWDIDERYREGNRWVERHGSETFLIVSGSGVLTLESEEPVTFSFDECWGDQVDLEYWMTNPTAFVGTWAGEAMYCSVPLSDGHLELYLGSDQGWETADIVMWGAGWEEPPTWYGFAEYPGVDPGPVSAEFDVVDGETGDPMQPAVLDGYISAGETVRSRTHQQGGKVTTVETPLTMTGTLTLPDEEIITLDGYCFGSVFRSKEIWTQPQGPKPTGTPPLNDAPDGALDLGRGDSTQTKAAQWDAEVACVQEWDGDTWEIPIGKTVWYTVSGTGEDVTVSTSGTHFDTVLGVYDSGMTQIACIDDVFGTVYSYQAEVSFPTESGEVYYIQAGGFGGQFGLLKLSTR